MNTRKFIIRETGFLALGLLICIGAMIGIFAMLGQLDYTVILGGAIGGVLALANFFFMAISADMAADQAKEQEQTTGKKIIKVSYGMRLLILGVFLSVFAKTGVCNLIALVAPLALVFPIVMVIEFFRKSGDAKS
jgi:hypothetical protein